MHAWSGWESAYMLSGTKNGISTLGLILTPVVVHWCYFCGVTQQLRSNQLLFCWDPPLVMCGPVCITGHFT